MAEWEAGRPTVPGFYAVIEQRSEGFASDPSIAELQYDGEVWLEGDTGVHVAEPHELKGLLWLDLSPPDKGVCGCPDVPRIIAGVCQLCGGYV